MDRARSVTSAIALVLGVATVAAPLAGAAPRAVVFGHAFTLSGEVPTHAAGQAVLILARAFGEEKFQRIAAVQTKAGGRWSYAARPKIRTSYLAASRRTTSSPVVVRVSPFLDLDVKQGVLSARARTIRSLAGHYVVVQLRRPGGAWRNVRTLVLDNASRASTRLTPPHGRSDLRLYMPTQQAGAGYDGGYSAILEFRNIS
jgi:hypothetical protein